MAPHLVASQRRPNRTARRPVESPPIDPQPLAESLPAEPVTEKQILAHRPLVRTLAHWARKRAPYPIPIEDLIQVGWCGFLAGVRRYDPARNVPLGSFCTLWVRGALHRFIWKPKRLWENGMLQVLKAKDPVTGEDIEGGPETSEETESIRMLMGDLLEVLPDREKAIVRALHLEEQKPSAVAREHDMLVADVLRVRDEALAWLKTVSE